MRLLPLLLALLGAPALAEVPVVVTDIPPVQSLVAQVMGDLGSPVLLLERGADEHDFQLRPSQMRDIADADLIVWIGPDLTPWLDRATQEAAAPMLGLLGAPETRTRPFTEAGQADDRGSMAQTLSGADPHAWLDPANAALWVPRIAAELGRVDPENAATYAANAVTAVAAIKDLDAELRAALAPVADRPFVTYHNAYGYFATRYDLAYAGFLADGEAAEPGAAHLVDLRKLLGDRNIACVFPEAQHDAALAENLIEGTSARIGGAIDPVGSNLEPGPGTYAALMRGLATTLAACLQG